MRSSFLWLVFGMGAAAAGYYVHQTQEQSRVATMELKAQEARLASLQAVIEKQQATHDAGIDIEKKKLTALEHQLIAAQTALTQMRVELADANEELAVDGRMPDAKDDMHDEEGSLRNLRRQLEAVKDRLRQLDGRRNSQLGQIGEQKRAADRDYAWQEQARLADISALRSRLADLGNSRDTRDERDRVSRQLSEQIRNLKALQEQQRTASQTSNYAVQQVRGGGASQREALIAQRDQLQQQIDNGRSAYQDMKQDHDAHKAVVDADNDKAKAIQERVKVQEDVVAKLAADVTAEREMVNSLNTH